ncbi:MAG: 6-carboxytetrahydropterin synthase [Candidatus Methylacidiphilales bacterium]|nr:6-carboxytetrahydropterin synthase [Candidatus Methylacidiphilales bacterium]
MRVTLTREFGFDAAQSLTIFPEGHKCRQLHGHSFTLQVSAEGEVDPATGLLFDHARIKEAAQPFVDELDHRYLNEIPGLENPTIEVMCKWFWDRIKPRLPELSEIMILETPRAWCRYRGD